MRTFEHFPEDSICPLCGANTDTPCALVAIDGTGDGTICEAAPVHESCLMDDGFVYNRDVGVIYKRTIEDIL